MSLNGHNYVYLHFKIGDLNMSPIPPEHIQSFSYERSVRSDIGSSNKLLVTLYDETGILVEDQLSKGYNNCEFRYGYEGGASSKTYKLMITSYDVEFTASGATISLEGMTTGLKGISNPTSTTYGSTISDIVRDISKEQSWNIGRIEETEPVYESDGVTVKKFYRNNLPAPQFINSVLVPYAKSLKTGQGGYKLWFSDEATEDGKPIVYFEPDNYSSKDFTDGVKYSFEWGTKDSKVKSFNPNFSGILTAVSGGGNIEAKTVDAIKNELVAFEYSKDTDIYRPSTGSRDVDRNSYKAVVGDSSYSYSELRTIAANTWYRNAGQSYPAELVVLGDPNLEPQETLSIVVLNNRGIPHHSSGVYLIQTIVDSIEGGNYESQLSLIRNSLNVGVDDSGGLNITVNTISTGTNTSISDSTDVSDSDMVKKLIEVALSQEGTREGSNGFTKYGAWYHTEFANSHWCAMFVSWCANQASIPVDIIPKHAYCPSGINWFKSRNLWQPSRYLGGNYNPKAGDIIYFDWEPDGTSDHVGIVISSDSEKVYTIEGNTADVVAKRTYDLNSYELVGFGTPKYPSTNRPSLSGGNYTDNDFELLSRIIGCEAGGLTDEHQRLVGSVVLNRVKHSRYPNTIKEVIFQSGQYAPTFNGAWEKYVVQDKDRANAKFLLTKGPVAPANVIYQAEFLQGSGVYKSILSIYGSTTYFCYE